MAVSSCVHQNASECIKAGYHVLCCLFPDKLPHVRVQQPDGSGVQLSATHPRWRLTCKGALLTEFAEVLCQKKNDVTVSELCSEVAKNHEKHEENMILGFS